MSTEEEEVEDILRRQDAALELLSKLREAEPVRRQPTPATDGKQEQRRWPAPATIALSLHNGTTWVPIDCSDIGIGGARLNSLPTWVEGPVPIKLSSEGSASVIALMDTMWRSKDDGPAGIRFEFVDHEEREYWATALIDGILAGYARR